MTTVWQSKQPGIVNVKQLFCKSDLFVVEMFQRCACLLQGKPVGTPGPSAYYRIITDHKVAGMFAAPTSIRAVRREVGPQQFSYKHTIFTHTFRNDCKVYFDIECRVYSFNMLQDQNC